MKKLLVVVDMQNDFITGALGTKEAQAIVPGVVEFVKGFDGFVVATQDTHNSDYLDTQEGKRLPVPHCIDGTEGEEIIPELKNLVVDSEKWDSRLSQPFRKDTFGSLSLKEWLSMHCQDCEEIHFVGVCTGICVIANAVIAKTALPEARIIIHKDLCACVTQESHERALKSMETLQMDIV